MKLSLWYKARYWVLLLLVLLITLSCHPTIVDMSKAAGMKSGTILSRYIILVFAGLFAMCLNVKSMLKPKIVRVSWIIWVWIVVYYLITYATFGKRTMMGDVRSIAISLVAIMIGWQLDLYEKKLRALLIAFSGLILFVGLMQVFANVGGFVILNQYETDNKNSLGVMLVSGAILFLFMGLNYSGKVFPKVLFFTGAVLTVVVLLTVRARAATLTAGIMALYIFYERFKGKNFVLYLFGGVAVIAIVYLILPGSVKDFVYNSFFQNYEGGDITAGRGERNIAALDFLSYHTFLGNLNHNEDVGWIHNYPLNRTFEFGIVFVIPIMVLYLYLLINTIMKTVKSDNRNTYNAGYYILLIPFIISMVEPTFPFGPGTATVINFLLFGVALRNTSNEKTYIINSN
jgi:hypothetical protein